MADGINLETRVELKKLEGVGDFGAEKIKEVLEKSANWITHFYTEAAGDKKVQGNFAVEGFSYGGEFDLSTAKDILDGIAPPTGRVPFLFLSDLVNFVEQIRTSLNNKNISLNSIQRQELDKLGNTFSLVGVQPANEKVSIKELQNIEYPDYSRRIVARIQEIFSILSPSIGGEELKITEISPKETSSNESGGRRFGFPFPNFQGKNKDQKRQTPRQTPRQIKSQLPDEKTPIKIAELDPQTRLYIQSLSIISINQALSKYFNDASLEKIGLPPGTIITFDQLPLTTRQKLMERTFSQVENLLLSGEFSLADLISKPSQRISFSNQAAFGLLMDVHGLNLINSAVRDIAKRGVKQIEQNEKDKDNTLNSKEAEKNLSQKEVDPNYARQIESELNIITSEEYLDRIFSEKVKDISGYQDSVKINLAVNDVRSIVEVFIQQGISPNYLIPDPRNFDYNRFVNIFGNNLDQGTFDAHKEELANLIIFYWKRKRAIWFIEVRRELAIGQYTPEEAQKLLEAIKKDPKKMAELRNLGVLNLDYGGRQTIQELSGNTNRNSEIQTFSETQRTLLTNYLTQELNKLSPTEQQSTLQIYFQFYAPTKSYETYSIELFQQDIAPKINPYDLYLLQMAESFEAGAFAADGSGYLQQAFNPDGNYQGTNLLDSALGQKGKKLATKALSHGLYMALDAAGGWGEALKIAEKALPIIEKIKNKLIEAGLEKVLEWLKKNWLSVAIGGLVLMAASLAPILILLIPAYFALRGIFGTGRVQRIIGVSKAPQTLRDVTTSQSTLTTEATNQNISQTITQTPQANKGFFDQFASSAMVTAAQAAAAGIGITAFFLFIQQTSLNSAFLTDFPISESEISNSIEKTSKYAEITKTAKIISGCGNSENDGVKCENPSFPLSIEYTVTIKPKEDFSLQITNIKDDIAFKQSQKGWEESGQAIPAIDSGRNLELDYFQNLILEQVGLSNTPLNTPSNSTDETSDAEDSTVEVTTSQTGEYIVIPTNDSLTFTYTLDGLGSNYNNTSIINTIEVNFYYQNDFMAGTDNVITAARVCLGQCGGDPGCWPATGRITQMPYGDFSHSKPSGLSFMDAYDIGCNSCSGAAIYGPPVYVPFDGNLCFNGCGESEGCYYTLTFTKDGESNKIQFLHFEDPNPALSTPNQCMQVEAGFMIGLMGNRGFSTGVHLHYGAAHNGVFYMSTNPGLSIIETLVPEDDGGNLPPKYGENVTTCY